jgi:uncharacterized membrane protein YhaH (DUF805 family)
MRTKPPGATHRRYLRHPAGFDCRAAKAGHNGWAGRKGKCPLSTQSGDVIVPRASLPHRNAAVFPQLPERRPPDRILRSMSRARRPLSHDDAGEKLAWAIEPFRCFAQFYGRAPRKEYWMFSALTWALSFLAWGADKVLGIDRKVGPSGPLSLAVTLIVLVPSLALAVRRLHDAGHRGWLLLLILVPLIGWAALVFLLAQEGEKGSNRYGADPARTAG